jgi:hypothetical protein
MIPGDWRLTKTLDAMVNGGQVMAVDDQSL